MSLSWVVRPGPGRRLVHVNATATGGGVAELLHSVVPAQVAAGTNAGWVVISGSDSFFALTKSVHHLLHDRGDPAAVADPALWAAYRSVLDPQAAELAGQLGPGDVVVLHDPQTLGLAPRLAAAGARTLWHCHIGTTAPGAPGPAAVWSALAPELAAVDGVLVAEPGYAPPAAARHLVSPAIDPGTAKNRPLSAAEVSALLTGIGLYEGPAGSAKAGSGAAVVEQVAPVPPGARLVVQVSRWDPLKDMPGVVRCVPGLPADVHLVLAGNDPDEIPDDPEGAAVLAEVRAVLAGLAGADRDRVHLVRTRSKGGDQALVVNALQRRADVVLQKSLAEGFGLTVTEAMAKGRAVVAGAVGGIRAQLAPDDCGVLVDPTDRAAVVAALRGLLDDPDRRRAMGGRAAARVARHYTLGRLVADYHRIAEPVPAGGGGADAVDGAGDRGRR